MELQVYNTLTKNKEKFIPNQAGQVKMYVCGPTVYDFLHIGNFRGPIFFNLVRNWLSASGYQVTYVYNYTDVDDKIIQRANQEGVDSRDISERFIAEFEKDFNSLKLRKHDHNPRVTDYIPQIIKFVDDLIKNQKAYVIDGEVFYAIDSFKPYGNLSGKKLDELEAGQRVEVDQRKKNPFDFVLWKPSKAGEPSWDSPWGKGRPGWHIECSAMIQTILGDTIDIHGGGIDLIFPHHENEIAQGEGRTGKCYCKTWMHNNFINMNDEKMSKSIGNVVKARQFIENYHAEILKYVMLSSHYRAMLNVNDDKILQAISSLARVYGALREAHSVLSLNNGQGKTLSAFADKLAKADKEIKKALDDDYNTPEMLAQIFEIVREFNSLGVSKKIKDQNSLACAAAFVDWMKKWSDVHAMFGEVPNDFLKRMDEILIKRNNIDVAKIKQLIEDRNFARKNKDFTASDKIRDELSNMGVLLLDSPEGTLWEMKK
jgi:cysteinyl-tRNA synthetase